MGADPTPPAIVCGFKGLAWNPEQQHCPESTATPWGDEREGRELRADLPMPRRHPCPYPGEESTHQHTDAEGPRNIHVSPSGGLCGANRGARCCAELHAGHHTADPRSACGRGAPREPQLLLHVAVCSRSPKLAGVVFSSVLAWRKIQNAVRVQWFKEGIGLRPDFASGLVGVIKSRISSPCALQSLIQPC